MTHRLPRAALAAATSVLLAAGAAGCGGSPSSSVATGKVTYVTAYGFVGRDAFAWVAQDKGYFRQAHLSVTIQPGAATSTNLKLLSSGQAQFAALDLTGAMIATGGPTGDGQGFRAFAAIHQKNLSSIISLRRTGITAPKDLEGRTLVTATGGVGKLLFPAYAKLAGIDAAKVKWVQTQPTQVAGVVGAGRADGAATFLIGTGAIQKAGNDQTNVLPYSNYLTDVYGNALITTPALAKSHPEEVKRFRDAMLKALNWTIHNPDQAAAILHRYQPTAVVAQAVSEIRLMAPYVDSAGSGVPLGAIDRQRIARSIALLESQGLIRPHALTPATVLATGLTPTS